MSPRRPARPNRLREVRRAAGLTQQQLADAAGAGRTTVGRAERGIQVPTLELADRIADVVGSSLDEAFSGFGRESRDEAYLRGYCDGLEHRDGGAGEQDPYATFVSLALSGRPLDRSRIWRLPDAIVSVQVFRAK
jgi:transcriptional regulator with XRE-family HTH domain